MEEVLKGPSSSHELRVKTAWESARICLEGQQLMSGQGFQINLAGEESLSGDSPRRRRTRRSFTLQIYSKESFSLRSIYASLDTEEHKATRRGLE